jgi:hypothetical protein
LVVVLMVLLARWQEMYGSTLMVDTVAVGEQGWFMDSDAHTVSANQVGRSVLM